MEENFCIDSIKVTENDVILLKINTEEYDVYFAHKYFELLVERFPENSIVFVPDFVSFEVYEKQRMIKILESKLAELRK